MRKTRLFHNISLGIKPWPSLQAINAALLKKRIKENGNIL